MADPSFAPVPAPVGAEELRRIVGQTFRVYDQQVQGDAVLFFVDRPVGDVDSAFAQVRKDLAAHDRLPVLKHAGGETQLIIVPKPPLVQRSFAVHLALYLATWVTTTLAGAEVYFHYRYWDLLQPLGNADTGLFLSALFSPDNLLGGFVLFALPLMATLTIHEMGHFVIAKRHGVAASLPFFIPLPPVFALNIGTMGAFISMREPIPDRKALLDIGVAGPLAGVLVAIPVTLLGLWFMAAEPVRLPPVEGLAYLGAPLLYDALATPFHLDPNQLIHPLAFAGWVGLLVTGINLLPAGQLDGGHVAHALLGERSRYLSFAAVGVLFVLGLGIPPIGSFPGFPGYGGWLIFGVLIAFLGVHHPAPLNGLSTLDKPRIVLGWLAMAVLVVCFTPLPLS
ncbi:MAG: site-2 protease family protein [Halobacteriales archaeon]|nr:site-2 protease family protein [Halobacteriales archaeon]